MRLCRILAFFLSEKKVQPGNFYTEIYDGTVCLQMLFCFGQRQQIFSVAFLWNKILFLQIKAEKEQIQAKCRKNQG